MNVLVVSALFIPNQLVGGMNMYLVYLNIRETSYVPNPDARKNCFLPTHQLARYQPNRLLPTLHRGRKKEGFSFIIPMNSLASTPWRSLPRSDHAAPTAPTALLDPRPLPILTDDDRAHRTTTRVLAWVLALVAGEVVLRIWGGCYREGNEGEEEGAEMEELHCGGW